MRRIKISTQLTFPMDVQTQTLVVYGNKGMGKTNFGSALAEELAAARLRFSVLDPLGNWWGLRHSADGHGAGVEVLILGGRHGDMPIEPAAGTVVADLVADEEVDVIIDISRRADGKMWSRGERIRFVADYATRLYERQGERMRPIMQIIDEAARFVPQIIPHGSPELSRCVGAIEQIVEEGRNVGIGVALITQRSARMNKSVSELAECMVAFRTIGPNSVAAVMDWLGDHVPKTRWADMVEQLRKLPRGHALVVSPGWLEHEGIVPIRYRRTFDSSATPKSGQERRVSGQGAKPDLARYQERMAATIEKAKAEDPRALRAEIARLKGELTKKPSAPALKETRVEIDVVKPATVKAVERAINRCDSAIARADNAALRLREYSEAAAARGAELKGVATALLGELRARQAAPPPQSYTRQSSPVRHIPATDLQAPAARVDLPAGELAILTAIAQYGKDGVGQHQIAVLTGYKKTSRITYISKLRQKTFVVSAGDSFYATAEGIRALGANFVPLPTGRELREYWMARLPEGERRMLVVLFKAYPNAVTHEAIEDATGYKKTSRITYLSKLRARRVIEDVDRGQVRMSEELA